MASPAPADDFSKDFSLDAGIFGPVKITLGGSADANAAQAILLNNKFPDGNIGLGHVSFTADTGTVSLKPETLGGASVSFAIAGSAQSGMGVYDKSADAIKALNFADPPALKITDVAGQRYLVMEWGYSASFSGSASHPVGLLGTVTFGVAAERDSIYAVLHRFDASQGAHQVIEDSIASWRLPRHVAYDGRDLNIKPGTWLLVEADGSLALNLAASLGWNINFAKDAKLLGVTHNLSARIDAGLKASFGFSVAGKYIVAVGREKADAVVRLQLSKQSTKGLDFGFNLTVGVQGADPELPTDFDDFIKSVFGVHGLQVLQDLRVWTDPATDLGQKLAGLADQTALDLLKSTTGIDPAAELNKAKQILGDALNTWSSLPDKLSSMLWTFLNQQLGAGVVTDFKAFLTALADPTTGAAALAQVLQKTTFGDTWQGQFLEAIADRGLPELANHMGPVGTYAGKVLDILNGGIIAKLQSFINQKLNLDQIRQAVTDADFNKIEQWLQNRLGNFLDKTLGLDDLKDIQKAIKTLDTKVGDYYKTGVQALTRRYSIDFAATYQSTTTDTALIDVNFDLSLPDAAARFAEVVAQSKLDNLLTRETNGVTLNLATLTHDINRKATVDLHMPLFDFTSTHVNDAMVSLTVEEQGGRLLLYQIDAQDKVTVQNRATSQLSVLASLKVAPGQAPQLDADGSIAYEMRQVKADMRPLDLETRTTAFIHQYLAGLFSGGDASIRSFYTDLDNAVTAVTRNQSNHLGDMAVSMPLSLEAAVLSGWFQLRDASQLRSDQMRLSRALQSVWKNLVPALYFTGLAQYQFNESVAALLVWSSLPVSTSISFDDPTISQFNTDKDVFWDWSDVNLRRAVARDSHTIATLAGELSGIQTELLEAGSGNASFFDPSMAGRFVELALNVTGDTFLSSLLFTEAQLARGATDALAQVGAALTTAATTPTQAIKTLAKFAADLTDTFNRRVTTVYTGMSGRVVGPMLLVESSRALGSPGTKPGAMLALYTLSPGHTFKLGDFIGGIMPPQSQVALAQTLVSLKSS
jgi:hypothetical protein